MSDSASQPIEASNELVRWLRLLALPLWARVAVLMLTFAVIAGGLTLLAASAWRRDAETASSAIALLTVSLPVMLIVIALVFGQNSDAKLRQLTAVVLQNEIPAAIRSNLGTDTDVSATVRGCCADYVLTQPGSGNAPPATLNFSVELNVYKVNVCFWLPFAMLDPINTAAPELAALRHVFLGAEAEGYRLNHVPACARQGTPGCGVIFIRTLASEFLLQPGQRLYFVQDLAFFVRGMFESMRALTTGSSGSQ